MKNNQVFFIKLFFVLFTLMLINCCTGKQKKAKLNSVSQNYINEKNLQKQKEEKSLNVIETSSQQEEVETDTVKVDTNKIYEQANVTSSAFCTLSESQIAKFTLENFKQPEGLYINGVILADLIIEKDGRVSDVLLVKGLHPDLDREAIRVLKLLPKFKPGKYKGTPVRSKLRMPVHSLVLE